MHVDISSEAKLGKDVQVGNHTLIEKNVMIGDHVYLGRNVIVREGTVIDRDCILEDNVIIGYHTLNRIHNTSVVQSGTYIGKGTLIRPNSVLYYGSRIGSFSMINHSVIIREGTVIGDHTSIGCLVKMEGYTTIGSHCSIHALSALTSFMVIEDNVFVGPGVIMMNDAEMDYKRGHTSEKKGPYIKVGARIGGHVTLCPGITVGREAFVVSGAMVTHSIPDFGKVAGVPARLIGYSEGRACQ